MANPALGWQECKRRDHGFRSDPLPSAMELPSAPRAWPSALADSKVAGWTRTPSLVTPVDGRQEGRN